MTRTTYLGWSQGANEANTEVAFLPNSWAVPVLPATQTLSSGKPPKAPAAVPWVTTPASAWRMYASAWPEAVRRLNPGGGGLFTTLAAGCATHAFARRRAVTHAPRSR